MTDPHEPLTDEQVAAARSAYKLNLAESLEADQRAQDEAMAEHELVSVHLAQMAEHADNLEALADDAEADARLRTDQAMAARRRAVDARRTVELLQDATGVVPAGQPDPLG